MSRRLPVLVLLVAPYALLALLVVFWGQGKLLAAGIAWAAVCLFAFLPCMACAFFLPRKGWSARQLLFWNMLLKVCNMPFFFGVFLAGMMMSVFVIPLLPFFVLLDYSVLLPSTMYGLSGLLQARREGRIDTKALIIFGALQFFFCLDVVSAVCVYANARKWEA